MKPMFPSRDDYEAAFLHESVVEYPAIAALEKRMGYAIGRHRLEGAAKILACPVKRNPPNWQHGRVIYSILRKYLEVSGSPVTLFDCGTAKGFSALCMAFALADSKLQGSLYSVDVIDPSATIARNSILDLDGPKSLAQYLEEWPEAQLIRFEKAAGGEWLRRHPERIHFAFIDGKHEYHTVKEELRLLEQRQEPGDISIFDDLQIPGVSQALNHPNGYSIEVIKAKEGRRYAVAVRL